MKTIRIAVLVVLGAAVVALGGVGRPDSAGGASKPDAGITVHGTGTVKAVPDEAEFSLAVQTSGGTAREALAANSAHMRRVLAAVRSAGVASDIQTQEVSISQSYDGNGHPNGYSARNSVSVKIHPLAKAGSVLDAAANAGANDVYGPTLSRTDREQLQGDALRAAVENAHAKAKALAGAAGVQLGDVTAISEDSNGSPEPYYFAPLRAASSSTPIAPGKEDIQASVTVTFAIG